MGLSPLGQERWGPTRKLTEFVKMSTSPKGVTVKPVYKGHLTDKAKVSFIERCPLYRGFFVFIELCPFMIWQVKLNLITN